MAHTQFIDINLLFNSLGERPYKCKVCNKGHRDISTMKVHMRTHNKVEKTVVQNDPDDLQT